jgi:hypothetical protein
MFFNAIFFARRPYGASFVCVCAAAFITGGSENLMKRRSNNIGSVSVLSSLVRFHMPKNVEQEEDDHVMGFDRLYMWR